MRAFAVRSFGEEPAIFELETPIPDGKQDFLIRVACAGVNPIDYKRMAWLTADARFPLVPGVDFAGTIEQVPPGEHGYAVGDRVFGMARRTGAFAEYALTSQLRPGEAFARIPDGVTFEQAAVLPVAGVTALGGLDLLAPAPGQTLVVLGAGGGIGGYAIPIARARGIHVIAVTRGNAQEARQLGAHAVFDATDGDAIDRIRADHPAGVDAVLDLVSDKDSIIRVAEIVRQGGRLVSAQRVAHEQAMRTLGITAYNIAAPDNPKANEQGLAELANAVASGAIAPRITLEVDLDHATEALERVRAGGLRGKAVIRVSVQEKVNEAA